jgi:hypothetical protein
MTAILFDSATACNLNTHVFGLGVRELDAIDLSDMAFFARLKEIEANEALMRRADEWAKAKREAETVAKAKVATRLQSPTDADRAWELGYSLGESGYEIHEVRPPGRFAADEIVAFAAGLVAGIKARWDDYGRWCDEQAILNGMGESGYEPEERELAECGSVVGHEG